jgi:hypothetical protein
MQAIELEAAITGSHEIHLQLPEYIHASHARVIVMYENEIAEPVTKKRVFGQYRNKITIADTFDDELPVSFWLSDCHTQ